MVKKIMVLLDDADHALLEKFKSERSWTWSDLVLVHIGKTFGDKRRFNNQKTVE